MKKRYTDEQINGLLKQADTGTPIKDPCRKHGFSDASFYLWRRKFGGTDVTDAICVSLIELKRDLGTAIVTRSAELAVRMYRRCDQRAGAFEERRVAGSWCPCGLDA